MGFFDRKVSRRAFVVGGAASAALAPTLARDVLAALSVDQEEVRRFWSLDPKGKVVDTSKTEWVTYGDLSMKAQNYSNYPQRFRAEAVRMDAAFAHAIWNSGEQFVLENPVDFGVGDIVEITNGYGYGDRYLVTRLQDHDKFWVEAVPVIETRGYIKADTWSDWGHQYDKGVF